MSIPSREVRIILAPLPWELAAPSMDNLQTSKSSAILVASVGCAGIFKGVNYAMKFDKTCPLTAVLGLYLMSNSSRSMAHFISLPEASGLCNICLIGYSVKISIV